jgi:hypothetical protein
MFVTKILVVHYTMAAVFEAVDRNVTGCHLHINYLSLG